MVIEGDAGVANLRQRCGWPGRSGLTVAQDGGLVIKVGHGSIERVHHVDIEEGPTEVVVTAWIGTLAEAADKTVTATMELRLWSREIELSASLGNRSLRDGAPEPPFPASPWRRSP